MIGKNADFEHIFKHFKHWKMAKQLATLQTSPSQTHWKNTEAQQHLSPLVPIFFWKGSCTTSFNTKLWKMLRWFLHTQPLGQWDSLVIVWSATLESHMMRTAESHTLSPKFYLHAMVCAYRESTHTHNKCKFKKNRNNDHFSCTLNQNVQIQSSSSSESDQLTHMCGMSP